MMQKFNYASEEMSHDQQSLLFDLEQLLDSLKVMTIATPLENGVWSAPVYYLYKNRAFWFFSSPDSRHITGAKPSPNFTISPKNTDSPEIMVAASIFMDNHDFNKIKGIQMRGKIEQIVRMENMVEALAYIRKFGIPFKESKGSDSSTETIDPLTFIQKHYRAKFYRFIPTEMIYMDNSIYIGFKQKIKL